MRMGGTYAETGDQVERAGRTGLVSTAARALTIGEEVRTMLRLAAVVFGTGLLLSGSALAACVSVGSQVDCRWTGVAMRLGTQTDPHASETGFALRTQGFAGPATLGRPLPARNTLVISVQSFSDDPHACKTFGNETYCY
jgi:hypothetical protein